MAALVELAGSDTLFGSIGLGSLRGLHGMILTAGILGSPILTGVAALVIFVFCFLGLAGVFDFLSVFFFVAVFLGGLARVFVFFFGAGFLS